MTRSLVEKQFGAHAAAYATSAVHARGASLPRMVEIVAPQRHWRALDIATGAGHVAAALAPHVASVVAGDLTEEMLREAGRLATGRGLDNMTTARLAADALPFADASFDLVTCRIAAHHFPEPGRFVAEVARVLVPGGLVGLVDNVAPDAATSPTFPVTEREAAAIAYNDFERARDPSHVRALALGEWLGLVGHSGLAVRHVELMHKDMALGDWARRLGCDDASIDGLQARLDGASPALSAFLAPRRADGDSHFRLTEAIIVAAKSA